MSHPGGKNLIVTPDQHLLAQDYRVQDREPNLIVPGAVGSGGLATVSFGHQQHPDDWDDDLFIRDLYEDFLKAAQQDKIGLASTFEGWLRRSRETLAWRKQELAREHQFGLIDWKTHQTAVETADRADAAIARYLELPDNLRLIGV
jgi:hypothetical protein